MYAYVLTHLWQVISVRRLVRRSVTRTLKPHKRTIPMSLYHFHSVVHSFMHHLINSFIHSSIHSFIHSSIHPFIHPHLFLYFSGFEVAFFQILEDLVEIRLDGFKVDAGSDFEAARRRQRILDLRRRTRRLGCGFLGGRLQLAELRQISAIFDVE